MGIVYRARHRHLRRPTAIKLLPPDRSSKLAIARFEREVQYTSQLTHPNTIAIYDYGPARGGAFYYAMEFLVGVTLEQFVTEHGPVSVARAGYILKQVCGSLHEAHERGLVHRDIKPSNIFLCERGGLFDFVKVLDFGVAKEIEREDGFLTKPGALVGTPAYAAPEMIRGAQVDRRCDIYALGGVAYYLITGDTLFGGGSTVEILQRHIDVEPRPPAGALGKLEPLIMDCLAKVPGERPQTAMEVLERLESLRLSGWGAAEAREWWMGREPFSATM